MSNLRKIFQIVALTTGALCSWTNISSAATYTWDGAGTNSLWSNKTNWTGADLNWGGANDTAVFAGSTRTTNTNDLTAGNEIVAILFQTNASAFTLNGNALALNTGITQNSANIQTINLNIDLAGANTWAANSNNIVMNGVVSGAYTLTKTGTSKLILTASNTYTGATTISAGALNLQNSAGLGTTAGGTTVANLAALELQNGISVGAETLTINGTGVLSGGALRNISGNNTYGGLLTLGSASRINSDSGTLSLTNTATITGKTFGLTVGGAGDTVLNSILGTTTGTLTKDGAGKLTLGGANTFTGLTTVSGGTLAYGVANALSSGAVTVNGSGAALDIGTFSDTVGAVTLTTGLITGTTGVLTGTSFAMSGDGDASAILGGLSVVLTKTGAGTTTTLSGANTYTGATTITSGALNIQNSTGLGTVAGGTTVASQAALELQNGISVGAEALTLNGAGVSSGGALRNISGNNTYGGVVTLGSASRINSDSGTLSLTNAGTITGNTFGLTVGGVGDTVLNSILGTTTGTLTKDGAGKLTLTGGNTYTGATAISNGVVNVQNSTGLGTIAGGVTVANLASLELQNGISVGAEALILNGTGVSSGGALRNISGNNTYGGVVTLGSASRINSDSGTLSLTNAGTITGATFGLTVGGAGDTALNSILGTTTGTLTKDGAGKLTLGAANTFTGLTTVSNGTLAYGVGNALSSGAVAVNGASAVLDIGTFSDTVGAVTLTSGSITGTTGVLTGTSFAMNGTGSASAILNGSGATLTKTVAGTTTTLSGANTYTGATTITSGALNIQNSTGLGTTAGGVTVANLASLELQNGISVGAEALTLNGTGVSSGGALRNISGNNTYGGLVTLGSASRINSDNGTLSLTNAGTITGATFGLTVGGAGDTALNSILGTTTGTLTKDGTGKLTLGAANTFTGLTTVSNGTLAYGVGNALSSGAVAVNGASAVLDIGTFSDTVGAVTLTSGSITGTTGVLTGTSFAMNGTGSASAILGGSGATLTKTGAGTTTTLSKTNSYTGATTVTSGTLNVATGGSIASSSSTVAAGAAMVVNGTAGAVTLNGSLSGAGTVGALELNNGSSLNPGNSPGLLSASSSKWNAGATYNFQMTSATGTAGTSWDLLDVSTLLDLSALSSSAKFNLNIDTAGPLTGYDVNTPFAWTFAQSGSLALPSGYAFVSTLVASSIDITSAFNLTFTDASSFTGGVSSGFKIIAYTDPTGVEKIALVPEPSTGSLLLFGFGGLALLRLARRRRVG